jgi:hypothetical protein
MDDRQISGPDQGQMRMFKAAWLMQFPLSFDVDPK